MSTETQRFFQFRQNNSRGTWIGPLWVIVRAKNAEYANFKAQQEAGVYFDGCSTGTDCDCCGDRWHEAEGEGDDVPMVYDEAVAISDLESRQEFQVRQSRFASLYEGTTNLYIP